MAMMDIGPRPGSIPMKVPKKQPINTIKNIEWTNGGLKPDE
jgi:hypothetical protein